MAEIVESIEISRRPEEVFEYATDFTHFPQWQLGVISAFRDDDGPVSVGSSATVIRQAGPRKLSRTEEITELDAPRSWTVRGVGDPLIAIAKGAIEPMGEGDRSRLTITLEFEAHGIGAGLLPLVNRLARRQLPKNEQKLKNLLEQSRTNTSYP
jgi:uncharacterized protein YndB with AHSA1/START domain